MYSETKRQIDLYFTLEESRKNSQAELTAFSLDFKGTRATLWTDKTYNSADLVLKSASAGR